MGVDEAVRRPGACPPPQGGRVLPGLVAGIGFRQAASPDEIVALIRRAFVEIGQDPVHLAAIATAADRASEAPIRAAAAVFGLVPAPVEPEAMIAVDARVPTRSARIEASRRVGSVAEAAALALAGDGAILVSRRIAGSAATCALALPAHSATQAP